MHRADERHTQGGLDVCSGVSQVRPASADQLANRSRPDEAHGVTGDPPNRRHAEPSDPVGPPALRRLRTDEAGFTLVEVLVASVLLVIGVLASLALLDRSVDATSTSQQRDTANALAQEVVERAQGLEYTATTNRLVDVVPGDAARPGPADRLRAGVGDATGPVAPATLPLPATGIPPTAPQSWTVQRRRTTFTVSYAACTHSDAVQGVQVLGPYDCGRDENGDPSATGSQNGCRVGVPPQGPTDPTDLTVKLQLLGLDGLDVCVGALTGDRLAKALCSAVSSSGVLDGLLDAVLNAGAPVPTLLSGLLGSSVNASVCATQVAEVGGTVAPEAAATTEVAVSVAWTDRKGRAQRLNQTVLVRRPAA
jgi:prepilin-type N-terminal cleavage/methylation domain-containing protein